jgi:hypothetical protein
VDGLHVPGRQRPKVHGVHTVSARGAAAQQCVVVSKVAVCLGATRRVMLTHSTQGLPHAMRMPGQAHLPPLRPPSISQREVSLKKRRRQSRTSLCSASGALVRHGSAHDGGGVFVRG